VVTHYQETPGGVEVEMSGEGSQTGLYGHPLQGPVLRVHLEHCQGVVEIVCIVCNKEEEGVLEMVASPTYSPSSLQEPPSCYKHSDCVIQFPTHIDHLQSWMEFHVSGSQSQLELLESQFEDGTLLDRE